jgi:hypothetical protein
MRLSVQSRFFLNNISIVPLFIAKIRGHDPEKDNNLNNYRALKKIPAKIILRRWMIESTHFLWYLLASL